jgi:hypothetical protein
VRGGVRVSLALLAVALLVGGILGRMPLVQAQDVAGSRMVADADRALSLAEQRMLDLINGDRLAAGLPLLEQSPALVRAARWKAAALATEGNSEVTAASHNEPGGTWEQRIIACGYPDTAAFAETLGIASLVPNSEGEIANERDLVRRWELAPPDSATPLNPQWRFVGLARAIAQGQRYWVVTYGAAP